VYPIFISHGSKKQDERDFLDALVAALCAAKDDSGKALIRVLVDRHKLKPGMRWREAIYSWMLWADTALIVVSDSARRSRWVPLESMVLRWRNEIDPKFKPLVIMTDGLDKQDLAQPPFAELGLNDLNFMKLTNKMTEVASVVSEVRTALSNRPKWDRTISKLEEALGKLDHVDSVRYQDAVDSMPLSEDPWDEEFRSARRLAARLHHYEFREYNASSPYPAVQGLGILKDVLQSEKRRRIYDLLCPLWVRPTAAANLYRSAFPGTQPRKVIVLHCDRPDTPDYYLRRAWSSRWEDVTFYRMPEVDPLVDTHSDRKAQLRSAIFRVCVDLLPDRGASDSREEREKRLEAVLRNHDNFKRPVAFVVTQSSGIPLTDLVALQNDMTYISLVYMTGDRSIGADPKYHIVRPKLRSSEEKMAMTGRDFAWSNVK